MKKLQIIAALLLFILYAYASATDKISTGDEVLGTYWSPKKDAKIEIYQRGKLFFGKFIWLAAPRKDIKNPKQSLRSRDIVGLEFLTGFRYASGIYKDGEIYDPESGKTYSCKMTLDINKLKVRGYIGISLLGRTEVFERVR